MVRTNQPLVERMALCWHDWFATADVGQAQLNLNQNDLFRRRALGIVLRPAARRHRRPGDADLAVGQREHEALPERELRPRADGAVHARRRRRLHRGRRPRAGPGADRLDQRLGRRGRAPTTSASSRSASTRGRKTIFGQTGAFDWEDSCRLCLEHPAHADFFVRKLWSYFIPKDPPKKTLAALEEEVPARLRDPPGARGHPHAPRPVRGPADDQAADRADRRDDQGAHAGASPPTTGRGSPSDAGQRLFDPPNVSGWDEERWLDTARVSGRWSAAAQATRGLRGPRRGLLRQGDRQGGRGGRPALLGQADPEREDPRRAAALRPPGRGRSPRRTGRRRPTGPSARTRSAS